MGCTGFQILMSAKLQTPASKNAITFLGVSIVLVQRGMKAMAGKSEQVAVLQSATPGLFLLHYVSI